MFLFRRLTPFLSLVPTLCVSASAQDNILPIGQVQGTVPGNQRGTAHKSTYAGEDKENVTVQGVITGRTLSQSKDGGLQNGFFLQNTAATADKDANSSDGIWVFLGRFTTLRGMQGNNGTYTPKAGDEVVLNARVVEYFGQTQLSSPRLVRTVRSGVNLDQEVPAFDVMPPDDLEAANRYWERHEGMRGRIPAGSPVIMGRRTSGYFEGEIDVIRPNHPVAQRTLPYARRVFRDFHPLDDIPERITDNGNGYRIGIGSLGLKAASASTTTNLPPIHSFQTLNSEVVGGLSYAFGRYIIQPETAPTFQAGTDPALNAPPRAAQRATEYSLATYNVENLYDFRDDPNDGADFEGNPGGPGVTPPFDYVPKSQAEYDEHRHALASQIVNDLHAPDVLFIEEAEDQDICKVENGQMACGTTNNADGSPDVLQELALDIKKLGGPSYKAYFDRDGADTRGIIPAFMLREDTASLVPAAANDPILGSAPKLGTGGAAFNTQVSNPKALNAAYTTGGEEAEGSMIFTRAPQVAAIKLTHGNKTTLLYCIVNHFSSGPDRRVEQRRAQSAFVAQLSSTITAANPNARVVVAGDLNVYPRPDDPFSPAERKSPSDQLAPLYDVGLFNLFDVLIREVPASAYSYLYQGQAQTLDHIFLTRQQRADLVQVRVAHINADWPGGDAVQQGGKMRGASDHDPCVAIFTTNPQIAPENLDAERPGPIRWPEAAATTPTTIAAGGKVNLNTATEAELIAVNGIGQATARRILEYRQQNGPFKNVDELANIRNIGPQALARLKPFLTVE